MLDHVASAGWSDNPGTHTEQFCADGDEDEEETESDMSVLCALLLLMVTNKGNWQLMYLRAQQGIRRICLAIQ